MASNICNWSSTWDGAPDMDAARHAHTATVLKNGKILVCGGVTGTTTVGTALLFDPATRAYTPTASLSVPRHSHAATILKDGNVLVTGGFSTQSNQQLSSAELYNWLAGTWSLLPAAMTSRRQDHTATLTGQGNVLLIGGFGGPQAFSTILDSIEVFILTSQTFSSISHKMQNHRMQHTATMQGNGFILVAGGQDSNGPLQSAETYDPNHPPFNPAGNMTQPRSGHTATLLAGGGVLLVGGAGALNSSGTAPVIQASAEIFTGTLFQSASAMAEARVAHAAVDLGNGAVLVCGGEGSAGPLASAELYDPALSGFRPAGSMATARSRPAVAVTGDGGALICGGKSGAASVASSELFDPLFRLTKSPPPEARQRHTVTQFASGNAMVIGGRYYPAGPAALASVLLYQAANDAFVPAGALATGRFDHTATLLSSPDRILVVGGSTVSALQLASAELYDLASSSPVPVGQPALARTQHTATVLPNGKVLIVGGTMNGAPLNSAELFDPSANSFAATGSLTYGRAGHSATLLPSGQVLLVGGMSTDSAVAGGTGITFTTEMYDPATGQFTLQPQPNRLQVNRSQHTATVLTNGKVLFAGGLSVGISATAKAELYDPASNTFTNTGPMMGPRIRHTATRTAMPNGQVMIVGGHDSNASPGIGAVELFDPTTGTFSRKGDLWFPRFDHAAVLTKLQRVLVIGGTVQGIQESAELSKPTDCSIQQATTPSGCFIATAAFGSELEPEVERLRAYRDRVLMRSAAGRSFVAAYYRWSPGVATLVARSSVLRRVVRAVLRARV